MVSVPLSLIFEKHPEAGAVEGERSPVAALAPTKSSPSGMHINQRIYKFFEKNMVTTGASLDSCRIITTN